MKFSIMVATFPFGASEHPDVRRFLISLNNKIKSEPRIGEIHTMDVDDTPITMSRNRVQKECVQRKIDLTLMLDSDMRPDMYLGNPGVKPFWDSSFEFMLAHQGPCVIAAPYGGPPPHENCYVFQWARKQSDHPNVDLSVEQFSREEAATRGGFQEVAALPTGLILIDNRCMSRIQPPWFEYEYSDPPFNTRKATTEDVFFTRNLSLAGVPQYVNWDAWAGHHKRKCVGKPSLLTTESVRDTFKEALLSGRRHDERLVDIRPGGVV